MGGRHVMIGCMQNTLNGAGLLFANIFFKQKMSSNFINTCLGRNFGLEYVKTS